jgi:probable O-glycosylation ligase (exosortase A-associated)
MKGLLFTYGLTYGGAAAALVNPFYGFLIYVCFGILRPESMWPWSVPPGNYSRIIAIVLIGSWLIHGCGKWNLGQAKPIVIALCTYWAVAFFSTMLAPQRDLAWNYFELLSKILLPLLIGCTLLDSVQRITQLIWVIALSQGYVALDMNMSYFAGVNKLYRHGFSSLDNNTASVAMVVCAGLSFFLALHEKSRLRQAVAAAVFLLCSHAVMFSFSRGALLALICAGMAGFVVLPKRPIYIAAMIVAVLVGARMAGPQVIARFKTTFSEKESRDASAESRLTLWRGCLSEMVQHPLVGIGPDHWKTVAHHHGVEYGKAAHSMWMQTAAECGATGLISLALFFFLTVWRSWRLTLLPHAAVDPQLQNIARMVLCGLCGFMVAAQFVSVGLVEISYYVAAVGIGTLRLASATQPAPAPYPKRVQPSLAWR